MPGSDAENMPDKINKFLIAALVISTVALAVSIVSFINAKQGSVTILRENKVVISDSTLQKIFAPNVPDDISFCSEKADLSKADLRERFDRELIANSFAHGSTLIILKRSGKYFPVIETILKKNNVPDDLKYLCVAESSLSNAISPSDAVGFWQFLEETAKQYGLEINDEIDERYHVEKSTEAACKFLKEAKQKAGNWALAAASYNSGMGGVHSQIELQKKNNFYDLLLNQETSRYLFRIMSLKYILENPEKCGYFLNDTDYYKPTETESIEIYSGISDLVAFAFSHKTNYKLLKLHNPWLRKPYLTNKERKTYTILIEKI
ncbi:MAG: lytic transglycosylase domain-containing protein [Bacteroidia bacterium]|nr:lytic transglycosylase domain-containing protein [Bacteroidia bacterium]